MHKCASGANYVKPIYSQHPNDRLTCVPVGPDETKGCTEDLWTQTEHPSNLIPMSHWAGDIFMLTFPDAANNQAVRVDLIRVTENNCSCSENLPKYLSQPLWLLLSAICLPIANGCQSAQLYHLRPFHWLCPFDMQLICLYMQSVHTTICLISNLSSLTLQDDESKVYLGHPLFFLWLPLE